jgi:hypothetical protein
MPMVNLRWWSDYSPQLVELTLEEYTRLMEAIVATVERYQKKLISVDEVEMGKEHPVHPYDIEEWAGKKVDEPLYVTCIHDHSWGTKESFLEEG